MPSPLLQAHEELFCWKLFSGLERSDRASEEGARPGYAGPPGPGARRTILLANASAVWSEATGFLREGGEARICRAPWSRCTKNYFAANASAVWSEATDLNGMRASPIIRRARCNKCELMSVSERVVGGLERSDNKKWNIAIHKTNRAQTSECCLPCWVFSWCLA